MAFNPQPKKGMPAKKAKKPLKRTALKKAYKSTGEKAIFEEILQERGAKSQISGVELAGEFNAFWFSHILGKKAYPSYIKNKRNIILKTPAEHIAWETDKGSLRSVPRWKWVFELEQQLKEEYYKDKNIKH